MNEGWNVNGDRWINFPQRGPKVILMLTGEPGAGKDTVGNILVEKFGYKSFSFAQALKNIAASSTGLSYKVFDQHPFKDTRMESLRWDTPRDVLIRLSNTMKYYFGDECFAEVVGRLMGEVDKVVVTDFRFEGEARHLRYTYPLSKVIPIAVSREGHIGAETPNEVERIADVIENHGTLEQLHEEVRKLVDRIGL